MRIEEGVREVLLAGSATIVATRDGEMRPAVTRAWGFAIGEEGEDVTLCLGAPEGSRVLDNIEANGEIAVTCSRPTTYRTVQVKGSAEILGSPSEEQLAAVEAQQAAFTREVVDLGLPSDAGERLTDEELVAVRVVPREVFDQTPGPGAGAKL